MGPSIKKYEDFFGMIMRHLDGVTFSDLIVKI